MVHVKILLYRKEILRFSAFRRIATNDKSPFRKGGGDPGQTGRGIFLSFRALWKKNFFFRLRITIAQ